jgi:putative two-component system response regulator
MRSRVLIADDDPELRLLLRLMLARDGYDVIEAETGEQVLQRAIDSSPALILLDIMMPGINGFETCRQLKSDGRSSRVPVIFVTALGDRQSREQGLAAGADDYVVKPIDPKELRRRIQAFVQQNGSDPVLGPLQAKAT